MLGLLDQSFSLNNFRKIYDIDRKNKGKIEKDHFPEAYNVRLKIIHSIEIIKILYKRYKRGKLSIDELNDRKSKINEVIEKRKEEYNSIVDKKIIEIMAIVNAKGYSLPLAKLSYQVGKKDVFSIGNKVEDIFLSRQIQYTLGSIFDTKVNNRDLIVSRLSILNKESSPKFIIRADIENFYESINHKELLDIIHASPKLSVAPKRVITLLVKNFKKITGLDHGLPRGVGISAYLSEIYMNDIDVEIQSINDITYYDRYVDDMVLIFSPRKKENLPNYLKHVSNIIKQRRLKLNNKTVEIDLFNKSNANFEYLGYEFKIVSSSCSIKLSSKKINKIKGRIDRAFDEYNKTFINTPKKSFNLIILRLKFLTGNTRLHNSKSNAFVGVYFSNRFVTDSSDLVGLDSYLKSKLKTVKDIKLINKINKLSFEKGFNERIFRNFTTKELSEISKVWKNV